MTSILAKSTDLSVATFYWRRIKRIFPTCLLVISFVLLTGFFVMIRFDFGSLKDEALWSSLFINNFPPIIRERSYFELVSFKLAISEFPLRVRIPTRSFCTEKLPIYRPERFLYRYLKNQMQICFPPSFLVFLRRSQNENLTWKPRMSSLGNFTTLYLFFERKKCDYKKSTLPNYRPDAFFIPKIYRFTDPVELLYRLFYRNPTFLSGGSVIGP